MIFFSRLKFIFTCCLIIQVGEKLLLVVSDVLTFCVDVNFSHVRSVMQLIFKKALEQGSSFVLSMFSQSLELAIVSILPCNLACIVLYRLATN